MPGPEVRPLRSSPPRPPVHRGPVTLVGRVIGDRYRLIAPIAEGVASSVYKAEHVRMGKVICVKILRGPLARDPDLAARFRAEGRVVSRLSHPHTIAVFDFGELEANEGFYLAMEYLHGENLFDVLRREGRLPEARAAAIGDQLLGALGEAHEAGIVHRDVKPANVMLLQPKNDADFVKLLDFGIAEIEGQGPGGGLGTPAYLSPEQASGAAPDARSDLYSLGAMLYEMVGGRPPFVAENPLAVLSAHLHEDPAPLRDLCPEVSPGFAEVVHRALAKRPQDRFRNSDEMRAALQAVLEGRAATLVLDLPQDGQAPEAPGVARRPGHRAAGRDHRGDGDRPPRRLPAPGPAGSPRSPARAPARHPRGGRRARHPLRREQDPPARPGRRRGARAQRRAARAGRFPLPAVAGAGAVEPPRRGARGSRGDRRRRRRRLRGGAGQPGGARSTRCSSSRRRASPSRSARGRRRPRTWNAETIRARGSRPSPSAIPDSPSWRGSRRRLRRAPRCSSA